jgi:hypothetical protein
LARTLSTESHEDFAVLAVPLRIQGEDIANLKIDDAGFQYWEYLGQWWNEPVNTTWGNGDWAGGWGFNPSGIDGLIPPLTEIFPVLETSVMLTVEERARSDQGPVIPAPPFAVNITAFRDPYAFQSPLLDKSVNSQYWKPASC